MTGIKRVTGHTIAYAAVQVSEGEFPLCRSAANTLQGYFQLSLMSIWGIVDENSTDSSNPFNLQDFYNNIVVLFEGDNVDNVWV